MPDQTLNGKSASRQIKNRYTDAPALHSNLILGSLQLLFWIVFHPSAWRNHIIRIDPTLPADFTLTALTRTQWRHPALRRMLGQAYLVLPLLTGAILFLMFWFWLGNAGSDQFLASLLHFMAITLAMGLFLGLVVSVAAGLIGGLVTALLVGFAGSFTGSSIAYNFAIGLSLGLAAGVNGNLSRQNQQHSPLKQMGGIAIGVVIGFTMVLTRHGVTLLGEATGVPGDLAYGLARSLLVAVSFGIAIGWQRGLIAGLIGGVASGFVYNIVLNTTQSSAPDILRGLTSGWLFGISLIAMFALPYVLAMYVAGVWAGAWAGALGSYGRHIYFAVGGREGAPAWSQMPLGFVGVVLGLTVAWWRPIVLYPLQSAWNLLLLQADKRQTDGALSFLRWHSAFWDEGQLWRLYGLDDHLLLVMERDPIEGQAALEYLATGRQRWAAQAVQIELDARRLERCAGVMAIREIPQNLAPGEFSGSPVAGLLRSFSRTSQDVDAALNQSTAYNQRQALKAIEKNLDGLLGELTRSSEPHAVRFRPIAARWHQIVADRVQELAIATATRQEIDSPYVIGLPLMAQQEVFVGRTDISAEIEQFLKDRLCPPLFLYGQRRMGKTSLLNNLGRLLPGVILPMFVDLQGPASWATDHAGFLYRLAQAMLISAEKERQIKLPPLPRETLAIDPFVCFDEWLNAVEKSLDGHGMKIVLLALDEFEALDDALSKGRFEEQAVLGMLRHLIQHRPRFKVLLAGSHTLEEFHHWSSYLINTRLIHLSYLNEIEARQLIERPIEKFALRYEPEASQRVLDLTRGHPFLVQLLCGEIVALKNKQNVHQRPLARLADVELAVEQALNHGSFYFADIQHNRVDEAGLAVLACLARQGERAIVRWEDIAGRMAPSFDLDQTLTLLKRYELVEAVQGGYRFQVELIRRWFVQIH